MTWWPRWPVRTPTRQSSGDCEPRTLPAIAIVVVPVLPPLAIPVAPAIAVPAVVVIVVPARSVPVPFEVAAALPVWLDPVRFRERRTRPVAVMPEPAPVSWIPIAFDPQVPGARLRRHAIHPRRRWRRAEREAERNLRVMERGLRLFRDLEGMQIRSACRQVDFHYRHWTQGPQEESQWRPWTVRETKATFWRVDDSSAAE
jgi:hypothetical protein